MTPILMAGIAFAAMIFAGALLDQQGTRPADQFGIGQSQEMQEHVAARQFALFARAALNAYAGGAGAPPTPCYSYVTLGLPPGYQPPSGWGCTTSAYGSQTLFWSYGNLSAPTLSYLLSEPHGQTFGVLQNGVVNLPGGGVSPAPPPASIPNGDIVSLASVN